MPQRDLALPQRFLEHGNRADLLAEVGLTAQDVARRVTEWASALPGVRVGVAAGTRADRGPAGFGPDGMGGFGPEEQAR